MAGARDGEHAPAPSPGEPRRTLVRRVLGRTVARWGARLGLMWIVVLVIAAVFAPLIANTHPLLMKAAGQWSSPLLRHLGAGDVVLLVMFFAALIALALPRVRWRWRMAALAGVLVVSSVLSGWLVNPPSAIVYSEYRERLADGEIERVIHAPIPYSPQDRLRDQPDSRLEAPDGNHLMGTTNQGADLAANMIYASRIALSIGFISTGIALFIGIIVGGVMGYFSGVVDLFGMRFVEIISAIPTLFLLLALVAVIPPEYDAYRLYLMMVLIGLTSWVGYALFIRAEFLRLRQQEFVEAAQALGLPLRSILFRHMLPNGVAPVLVAASFGVAGAILAESTLSFLGIGLIGEASWGNLLNQALGVGGSFYWWIALYPGLAIFLTVFAYNLIGEALRDAIDPRLQGSNG
ncbi:MAG: ABC transporter permease [Phycisphaeraceae bacterium]